jgi:transposase-like protein|tara:strand:+ start:312 stop:509 length:198 start_codon:yes stop_codon:yes gene_type:complete
MKFTTEIVTGDCPECAAKTMLVNVYSNVFRCVTCGSDIEQKVNGVIKYMKVNKEDEMILHKDLDG